MNNISQFWPWITEIIEESEKQNENRENETKNKLQEEKFSLDFDNIQKTNLDKITNNFESSLINKNELNSLYSKIKAEYINNKIKWLDFNLKNSVIEKINSMSFKSAWRPEEAKNLNEYTQKNQKIRNQLINSIKNNTNDTKQKANEQISWKIGRKEQNNTIENNPKTIIKNLENNSKINENINFPIIQWLHKQEKINDNDYIKVLQNIENKPKTEIKEVLLTVENKDNLKEITENNKTENIKNFDKILKQQNIEWLETIKDTINNKESDSIYKEIHNIIWENFIQIDKQQSDIKNDLNIAIKTAWNNIIDKYPTIKKFKWEPSYENAFNNIKSWNIKSGVEGLKNLLLLWSTLAYAWWKLTKKQKEKAKWIIENKFKERITQINKEIKQLEINLKKEKNQEKIKQQIENLKKEKQQITSWELFKKAWKIDKSKESPEKKEKN